MQGIYFIKKTYRNKTNARIQFVLKFNSYSTLKLQILKLFILEVHGSLLHVVIYGCYFTNVYN